MGIGNGARFLTLRDANVEGEKVFAEAEKITSVRTEVLYEPVGPEQMKSKRITVVGCDGVELEVLDRASDVLAWVLGGDTDALSKVLSNTIPERSGPGAGR